MEHETMSEKTDTGKEESPKPEKPKKKKKTEPEPDPLDSQRKVILGLIENHQNDILYLHKKIELTDSLQSIIKLLSGAKAVKFGTYSNTLEVSLPDIETLGVLFRELEYLKSKMPKVELTYSGDVAGDKVLAEVRIGSWG